MIETVFIYGLVDPRDMIVRYVGRTDNLKRRMEQHITEAKRDTLTHKRSWIRKVLSDGFKPMFLILEITNENKWAEAEKNWIAVYSDTITNLTNGGDVPLNWKGKKQSPDHIRKRVESRKRKNNYTHSEETKKKISQNRKGKNLGNTHTLGKKLTTKHKEKVSEALQEFNKNNPNYFKGRTAWNKGKKLTEEHKENLRKSWAKKKKAN